MSKAQIDSWMSSLSLEEKIALVAGRDFMCTNVVPRLGIPAIRMSDGPHGLRTQPHDGDNGVANSLPATCFPTASCSANSWRPALLKEMGAAMAEEAKLYGVSVILGPGVNIKRNPRCGRNFEYFSEDPFLAGKFGEAEINGIQENGIAVSLKHFALNNSENYRFMGDSVADMRAMREIYLRQFEYIVKEAKPATLMAAYNKINGTYCSEHSWLLDDLLRKEWGFEGLVMSDWGTTHDRLQGIRAGLDIEMPGDNAICRKWILDGVNDGTFPIEHLDTAVKNVLTLVDKYPTPNADEPDWESHHALAKKIALEGAVLLKNDGTLPLNEETELLIVGDLFEQMRYQGAGSSMINPRFHVSPEDAFEAHQIPFVYAQGYKENGTADEALVEEALRLAESHDRILVFAGLTDSYECEGMDRDSLRLPENQLALIEVLAKTGKELVVVLFGGSVVELPFFNKPNAILHMFLAGQNCGEATYDLLFGKANPSGRLAETWPLSYADVPFGEEYGKKEQDVYKESIYVGYRYYLTAGKEVRFPFGYGLSYTTFESSNLHVEDVGDHLLVKVDVANKGECDGSEVVQVYVSAPKGNVHKPLRELKGFAKLDLKAGEKKTAEIQIKKTDLRYWDIRENRFVLEGGEYDIQIGKDCQTIVLSEKVKIAGESPAKLDQPLYETLDFAHLSDEEFEKAWNLKIPPLRPKKPLCLDSRMSDFKQTFFGKILYNALMAVPKKEKRKAKKLPPGRERDNRMKGAGFLEIILDTNSPISLSMSSSGAFPYPLAEGFVEIANGHLIRGIKKCLTKVKAPALPVENKEAENHGK